MVVVLVCAFIIVTICYILRYRWSRKRLLKYMEQFDGPPLVPFFGNALQFASNTKEALKAGIRFGRKYDSPFRVWLFHLPYVIIGRPEDVQIISSKHLEKDTTYRFLADLLGDGLITCSNAKWKRRRRIVNPAFSIATLVNSYLHIFNKQNIQLINKLKKECDTGKHFDAWSYLIKTSMGYSEDENTSAEIMGSKSAYFKASVLAGKRFYQPWLQPSIIFKIYTYLTGCSNVFREAQNLPRKILKTRREYLSNRSTERNKITKEKSLKNLIDILIDVHPSSDSFNDDELTDEVLTIIFAGSETNAIINSFTLLMLAIKPDIQDKVFDEQHKIFGNSNRMPTAEDLSEMTFLEQCIKESLRWSSIVPTVVRRSEEDIAISNGYVIPAGARIVLSIYMVHHNKDIYPNPEIWNPENFSAEKIASRHPCSFIPFGSGVRMCLGYKYAMLSMKATLSTILRNYKLTTDVKEKEIEFDLDFVLRSANGYPMKLEYRNEGALF